MQTQLAVTTYDKFRDVDGGDGTDKDDVVINNNIFSGQRYYTIETNHLPTQKKVGRHYLSSGNELEYELLSALDKFKFFPNTPVTGLTYLSSYIPPTIVKFEPEQEIELLVKMSPKATRNIVVQITARNKGIPNPIL